MLGLDPLTQQNLMIAVIGLITTLTAVLQQWNAAQGRKRGEDTKTVIQDTKTVIDDHSNTLENKVIPVLKDIQTVTNGRLETLEKKIADLQELLAQEKEKNGHNKT